MNKLKNIRQVLGIEPRSLACRASVLTTTLQPPVSFPCSFSDVMLEHHDTTTLLGFTRQRGTYYRVIVIVFTTIHQRGWG